MKKHFDKYTTVYTKSMGIVLRRIKCPNVAETYCTAYDAETMKRQPKYDGYYYNRELKPVAA